MHCLCVMFKNTVHWLCVMFKNTNDALSVYSVCFLFIAVYTYSTPTFPRLRARSEKDPWEKLPTQNLVLLRTPRSRIYFGSLSRSALAGVSDYRCNFVKTVKIQVTRGIFHGIYHRRTSWRGEGEGGCSPPSYGNCVIFRVKRSWFGQRLLRENIIKYCCWRDFQNS